MLVQRIFYIVALTSVIIFYILYPLWFSWYLLLVVILLMPLDLALSLPGMITRKLQFITPKVLEVDSEAVIVVTTYQKKTYAAKCVKIKVESIRNIVPKVFKSKVSKSENKIINKHICPAINESRYEIQIDTSLSGVISYSIKRMWVVSLLGLFALPIPVHYDKSILVLPLPSKPTNAIALPRGLMFQPKPGGGYAEDHDLREYRRGDPVKSIHWKVSAKFDSIIIREPLVPPPHSRLLIIGEWQNVNQQNVILGRLRWISDYLLKWDMPFYIKFSYIGTIEEITDNEELIDYLYRVLCDIPDDLRSRVNNPERFTWVFRIDAGGVQ